MPEAPLLIWIDPEESFYYLRKYKREDDIKYVHANHFHACMEAAISLDHWLFEITNTLLNRPDVGEREMADMIDDAQLALDKWNRFLDGDNAQSPQG